MVMICTKAHREGLGDLVWLSYDASDKKGYKAKVQQAATLIAASHRGAKKLKEFVDSGRVGGQSHWDISLLRHLEEYGPQFGAPHAFPRIGHYQGHPSQSSDTEGWRDSHRAQPRVQEATRREHALGGRTRTLNGFGKGEGVSRIGRPTLFSPAEQKICGGSPPPGRRRAGPETNG